MNGTPHICETCANLCIIHTPTTGIGTCCRLMIDPSTCAQWKEHEPYDMMNYHIDPYDME